VRNEPDFIGVFAQPAVQWRRHSGPPRAINTRTGPSQSTRYQRVEQVPTIIPGAFPTARKGTQMKCKLLGDRLVTIHRNDGLRKRCSCARRSWASCPHPWHFSFKPKGSTTHHRFPIDRYADHPIVTRDEARDEAERLRREIRAGHFPPVSSTPSAPTTPADVTFATFSEKWRTIARANEADTLRANDTAICKRLGDLVIDGSRLADRPIGMITEDTIENAFTQLQSLAGSTWNKYRDAVRLMQRWGVKKGYLTRPWLSEDNEIVTHRATAKRDRRLVPDVLDAKGKVQEPGGEERRLLAHADPWLYNLIVAALESGARRGELLSFTWADVSLTRGFIKVRAENAKSGRTREIAISEAQGHPADDCDRPGRASPRARLVCVRRHHRQAGEGPKEALAEMLRGRRRHRPALPRPEARGWQPSPGGWLAPPRCLSAARSQQHQNDRHLLEQHHSESRRLDASVRVWQSVARACTRGEIGASVIRATADSGIP